MTRNGSPVEFSPIAYWRYVVGILVALFAIPALLQGGIAFFRAFFDTLTTMLLAVNVVAFGAIASAIGLYLWQRERRLNADRSAEKAVAERQNATTPLSSEQLYALVRSRLEQPSTPADPAALSQLAAELQQSPAAIAPTVERAARDLDATLRSTRSTANRSTATSTETRAGTAGDRSTQTPTPSKADASNAHPPLIQAQLARRLQVSPSTVGKRKHKPDFSHWAQAKDPEGLSWYYCQQRKQFYVQSFSNRSSESAT